MKRLSFKDIINPVTRQEALDKVLRDFVALLSDVQEYVYRAQSVPVWTSADGRVTPVTAMGEQWLENAIRVCERGAYVGARSNRALPAMRAELAKLRSQRALSAQERLSEGMKSRSCSRYPGTGSHARTELWRSLSWEVGDARADALCAALDRECKAIGIDAARLRKVGAK